MDRSNYTTIVLIAIETKMFEILDNFIGNKYVLYPIDNYDSLDMLDPSLNIKLFLINSDKPWLGIVEIIDSIKNNESYQNVPLIGLSMKKHFPEMPFDERYKFEDIMLMPCSYEDLLTRIEVWVKTYNVMSGDDKKGHTYLVDGEVIEE
ncbi:MAG: hypothetical protein ACTSVU_00955 [Promethearchaeota archaeon]